MDLTTTMMTHVWVIPAIMAGSFLAILLVGKRLPERSRAGIGIVSVGVCLVLSCIAALGWIDRVDAHENGAAAEELVVCGEEQYLEPLEAGVEAGEMGTPPVVCAVSWFESGPLSFEVGTLVDGLTVMMLFVVTLISLLVHIYSLAYVHGDVRHTHYYAFLSLFTASMLAYVMSSNTLQMLVGWELVGVCSFALIGHWWEERKNSDAALKAFMTNRVGDTGLIIGIIVIFFAAGGTSFNVIHLNQYALSPEASSGLLLVGALCLFAGVTSKSGQFPLHTWLPDAMAGPTPVSALIHAATMVVAGVYLVARLYGVFWTGFGIGTSTLHYLAFIGGLTTVIGAVLAFVQNDIKKVLAYSTISQLGYMVLALGVGAWIAGIFHLFTHAFFKAALFLGAGSVSHAAHHTFDMRQMGGLRKYMPITHGTFLISTLALAGIAPLAGFWSKDEILAGAAAGQGAGAYWLVLGFGLLTAFLTAAYMGRAYWMTFWGEYRGHGTPHESPKVMTVPLVVLTGFAVFGGLFNFPWGFLPGVPAHWMEDIVQPTFAFPVELEVAAFNPLVAVISVALAAGGLLAAFLYFEKGLAAGLRGLTERNATAAITYRFLENKYYLDALYGGIAEWMRGGAARASYWANQNVIDKVVNAAGVGSRRGGRLIYRTVDQKGIDGVVNGTGIASDESGEVLRRVQTGKVQHYGAMLFGGAVALTLVFVIAISVING